MEAFLGSAILLLVSFSVYFIRYPIWNSKNIEPIFLVLILSYATVLAAALLLIKFDLKKPFCDFLKPNYRLIGIGLAFALVFQAVWFCVSYALGGKVEFLPFPSLGGFENYAYYSMPAAFAVYAVFSVFGAFAEEVVYRGYVQTRVSLKHGVVAGVGFASALFALQHIHIFQWGWIDRFFQTQFIYVLCFGVFVGFFFYRCKGNLWAVFAFHGLMNVFNIIFPMQIHTSSPYTDWVRTILSFSVIVGLLYLLSRTVPSRRYMFGAY